MPDPLPLRYPVNALVSYHYYNTANLEGLSRGGLRLIGDSGAYSAASQGAAINLDDFAKWAHRWRESLSWVASLDVIGDPEGSYRNWRYLRTEHNVDVVPTVHYGAPGKALDRYVEHGVDYIGLGGMVPYKSEPQRLLRWCLAMFRYARDNHPQLRFHGWGVTHPELIMNLPWYSVDSSGWGESYRYGRLSLFDPRTAKFVRIALDGRTPYKHAALLADYATTPAAVAKSTPANRPLLCRIAAKAYQQLEDHLRSRRPVSAPSYGLAETATTGAGPNVHLADTNWAATGLVDPTGPHIHLAGASHIGTSGRGGDVEHLTGPPVHMVFGRAVEKTDIKSVSGPHVHLAEGSFGNLANLSAPATPEPEGASHA